MRKKKSVLLNIPKDETVRKLRIMTKKEDIQIAKLFGRKPRFR